MRMLKSGTKPWRLNLREARGMIPQTTAVTGSQGPEDTDPCGACNTVSGLFTSSHSPNLPQMDQNRMCSFRGIVQHFNRDASDQDSGGTSRRYKSLEVDCWERRKGTVPAVRYRGAIPLFVPIWGSWRLRPGLGKSSCLWSR
jgi:hypothetical protein